jgi:fatty-acid desaturase
MKSLWINSCLIGFITKGECWHNNHHAFPESARIGLFAGETDPGWTVLWWLQSRGIVWNLQLPRDQSAQEDLSIAAKRVAADRPC